MSRKLAAALLAGTLFVPPGIAGAEPITLEQAIRRASDAAPELKASEAAIDAARAGRIQAGVRPNPSVTVMGENLGGSGRYDVMSQAEMTASYAQTFERGGKRAARTAYADGGLGLPKPRQG